MLSRDRSGKKDNRNVMYRSNSSLDLIYGDHPHHPPGSGLRREYGSHGSIDVIGGSIGERAQGMVQRSDGSGAAAADHADGPTRSGSSPKSRLKLNKLWGGNGHGNNLAKVQLDDAAFTETLSRLSVDAESGKRQQFAHYDCQSLLANLSYAAAMRSALLGRRRNTTTGASAASLLASRGPAPGDPAAPDTGDGRSNHLVESCPFFRNELGGEEERCVSLCWRTGGGGGGGGGGGARAGGWHRPRAAYGLSVLEYPPGQSHWKQQSQCPFAPNQTHPLPLESQDAGALYYRNYFYNQPHQNWFGMDENLGPVAVSIKKERVEVRRGPGATTAAGDGAGSQLAWQYRLVARTAELLTLRGSVLEEALPNAKPTNNTATYSAKDVLEYVAPELQLGCLRLGVSGGGAEEQLLRLDEQCVTRQYKVGVLYCKAGQATEEEMYNNREAGPAFVEFLQSLGRTVRLKGFDKYRAGLDHRTDSTGLHSVYATHRGCELMFHVSTMLPYTPNNRQQLLRKRHIGNDIVTVVFQEAGAAAFTPRHIRSQFQHVFVVVRAAEGGYRVAVSRAREVPLFGPPLREGAVYPKGEAFTDLLLSKVINGENAAIQSPKFSTMATRTRQEYLKDLAANYVTATALDTGQKFSLFSSLLLKGGSGPPATSREPSPLDVSVGGALCFHVQVEDEGAGGALLECVAGISADTLVLVEEATRQLLLVVPVDMLLGWATRGEWTRVYYHRGECVRLRCGGAGGAGLRARLAAVAPPSAGPLRELTLERGARGHLGFHVQPCGLVTAVEGGGRAAHAGLRPGARLLEVCRAAVCALSHRHLLDLLTTSSPVTVAATPTAGCARCSAAGGEAQWPGRQRRAYEPRPLSPPRSDSSGYGTGGSGRSGRAWSPAESPRHRNKRHSANTNSLTEELMRYMDAELGAPPPAPPAAAAASSPATPPHPAPTPPAAAPTPPAAAPAAPAPAPTLPLPDASALDWSTLVHTATRAMLQICEEHQFPSIEHAESAADVLGDAQDSWQDNAAPPAVETTACLDTDAACACGLGARVAALEAEAQRDLRHRHHLEEEVRRLRRHNQRLREESARAVHQLRRFTQWFMHTVDRQH